jgi:hypothetical protein
VPQIEVSTFFYMLIPGFVFRMFGPSSTKSDENSDLSVDYPPRPPTFTPPELLTVSPSNSVNDRPDPGVDGSLGSFPSIFVFAFEGSFISAFFSRLIPGLIFRIFVPSSTTSTDTSGSSVESRRKTPTHHAHSSADDYPVNEGWPSLSFPQFDFSVFLPAFVFRVLTSWIHNLLIVPSIAWHVITGYISGSCCWTWSFGLQLHAAFVSTITSINLRISRTRILTPTVKLILLGFFTFFVWARLFAIQILTPTPVTPPIADVADEEVPKQGILVGGLVLGTSGMVHAALKVEQELGVGMGYETPSNWIIPKPAHKILANNEHLEYDSDLISFRHSCQWHSPVFDLPANEVTIGDEKFEFRQLNRPSGWATRAKLQNGEFHKFIIRAEVAN